MTEGSAGRPNVNPEERAEGALASHPDTIALAYQRLFNQDDGPAVLVHLAHLCGATSSALDDNPFTTAANVGRQEVWMAIQDVLGMTPQDLRTLRNMIARWGDEE